MTIRLWAIRIKNALLYKVGVHFPYNPVRIEALRRLGYTVGEQVYIAGDLTITQNFTENRGTLTIGNRVSIAPCVILTLISHANASAIRKYIPVRRGGVRIEDDCWIGAGAIILNGVTIGKGSVVGAGAVVTKDVAPYTIVAGNPARKIKDIPIANNEHTN